MKLSTVLFSFSPENSVITRMKVVIVIAVIFAAYKFLDIEAGLSIVTYDIEADYADPKYFRDIEAYIEDEGKDNEFFINFTLIKSLPAHATHSLKLIGASMGEFIVPTGIDFTVELCEALSEPIFGRRIYKSLGLDENVCPAEPGVYGGSHINFVDQDTLPETFPPNNYKIIVSAYDGDHPLFIINVFFKIQ